MMAPSRIDLWIAREFAQLTGRHPLFDIVLQSGINHYVLGGFWFAGALFVFWTMATGRRDAQQRTRLLTTLAGSLVAIALALLARHFIAWTPPRSSKELVSVFPQYVNLTWNPSSFPSDSTTLYASVATGIYSISRRTGAALWAAVVLLVALPRMYVGGHFLTDVLVGMALGLAGFAIARAAVEPMLASHVEPVFDRGDVRAVLANFVIFYLVLQVAIEFRDGVWLWSSLSLVRRNLIRWPHALR